MHYLTMKGFGKTSLTAERVYRTAGLARVSGIYLILCHVNSKVYVGSSLSVKTRIGYHRSKLRNRKHDNSKLQRAWNKYGEEAFSFWIAVRCASDELLSMEQAYMDLIGVSDPRIGFNLEPIPGRTVHSEETREKISRSLKGHKLSEETRSKIGKANRGKGHSKWSDESKAKLSRSLMGHVFSEETRAKMRAAWKRRAPISEETRRKMSVAQKGRPKPKGFGEQISAALTGKPKSEAAKTHRKEALARKKAEALRDIPCAS